MVVSKSKTTPKSKQSLVKLPKDDSVHWRPPWVIERDVANRYLLTETLTVEVATENFGQLKVATDSDSLLKS